VCLAPSLSAGRDECHGKSSANHQESGRAGNRLRNRLRARAGKGSQDDRDALAILQVGLSGQWRQDDQRGGAWVEEVAAGEKKRAREDEVEGELHRATGTEIRRTQVGGCRSDGLEPTKVDRPGQHPDVEEKGVGKAGDIGVKG
jgi:hypothetical protein